MSDQTAILNEGLDGSPVRRILVATKYRFIGDTLLAIPLLRAISHRWPEAKISLLTGARANELLVNCPYVHDLIEFDPYRKSDKGALSFLKLVGKLRQREFDVAFVCNRSFHAALIAFLAGSRIRIGWAGFDHRDFLLTHTVPYDPQASELESYLDLFRLVSPESQVLSNLELWVTDVERDSVRNQLPSTLNGPLIGIQPGATHAEKRWPAEKYAELMQTLLEACPACRFVLIGGPDERVYSEQLKALLVPEVVSRCDCLVGKLPLRADIGCAHIFRAICRRRYGNSTRGRRAGYSLRSTIWSDQHPQVGQPTCASTHSPASA